MHKWISLAHYKEMGLNIDLTRTCGPRPAGCQVSEMKFYWNVTHVYWKYQEMNDTTKTYPKEVFMVSPRARAPSLLNRSLYKTRSDLNRSKTAI